MIKQISQQELDDFLVKQKYSQFLQSSSWTNFEKSLGNNVWHIGLSDEKLIGVATIVEKKLGFGFSYLYCPRGPIFADNLSDEEKNSYFKLFLKSIRDITISTKKYKEIFFKFEPSFIPTNLERIKKVKDFQPSNTLLLNLKESESDLLSNMHQKTRYNINLAKKKGVIIERSQNKDDIKYFLDLIHKTSKRDRFVSHSDNYYSKILESKAGNACLWFAKYNDVIISANIVMSFGDTVTYAHGASSDEFRSVMAPHLLQWEQILWAKQNGYKIYDFWGISEDVKSPWAGFTRFKKGFGGEVKKISGTFEIVFDSKIYKIYNLYKNFRFKLRLKFIK